MIDKDEVLLKSNNEWLLFTNPHCIISATNVDDVRNSLQEVESLVNSNDWHAAGFVSYEAAPAFDNALHVRNAGDFPKVWFGLYAEPRVVKTSEVFINFRSLSLLNWQASVEREGYNSAIEKIKDHIAHGNTYQVNYTMRLNSEFNGNAWDLFLNLAQSQNKYAAYIDMSRYSICSASPELFFKLDGDNIYSMPMKGTVKRGRTTLEDKVQAEWLYQSTKNRAENVMIVDMLRNDLGRIAEIGSVHVPELFAIEKYPTLFQMTSTVQAKTKASLTEIFSALFPCASITGAPKVSTMKIISELETTPRKIYTGSIGYISPNRKAQFNVAIRTALIDRENKTAEYGVGGGIVWDSTSADEYSEALLKARVLTMRPHPLGFSLFETMLWTPKNGYFLLEKHIARLADSAEYFDFPFSKGQLEVFLDQTAGGFTSPKRVKVLLDRFGELKDETIDFYSQEKRFKVCLAKHPIDSGNVFLFHKTTRREIYPSPRAQDAVHGGEGIDDLLLFNERDELTEFTIGNLVVEIDGEFFTPPLACGLLAGTFRSHLLETNQIKERVIHKDELSKCSKVFLVNSVRRWVEVEIQKEPTL
ncbi:MAG: aminodeoxychorismate synthase component I [Anaerolineales bacterium]|nr:aminodeoxychorismate synthase component I [Anaerolineales bacterium]